MSYYTDTVIPFIDSIILDNKSRVISNRHDFTVSQLSDVELGDCVMHLFEADDRALDALCQNHGQVAKCLMSTLRHNTTDEKLELANTLRDTLIDYYSESLSQLLDERICQFRIEYFTERGFASRRHADNGEHYWSRQHA